MPEKPSEQINAEYVAEVEAYLASPVPPCGKAKALNLLKRFERADFHTFWQTPVEAYLPAVSEGTMKLAETVYPHDDAIRHAKALISTLDPKALARAFLYGLAHNQPAYRTALASYYYVKNLPEHAFERAWIGTNPYGDVFSEYTCEVCNYHSKLSDEPKMQFWHINMDMDGFYHAAQFGHSLNRAITFLEEYMKLPEPPADAGDRLFFDRLISRIEALPENTTPARLRTALRQSGMLHMTVRQTDALIDMLGYLDILHAADSFGMTVRHVRQCDMLEPLQENTYFSYPVYRWTRKCGIDHEAIRLLFDDLY